MRKSIVKRMAACITVFVIFCMLLAGVKGFFNQRRAVLAYQNGINISEDLTGGFPCLYQWDGRWAELSYGTSNMEVSGCGPTCLSMVWCGLTGKADWNPYTVAKMAEEKGYYVPGAGTSWELMTDGAKEMGLHAEVAAFSKGNILETLRNGKPIICAVGPGDFTTEGHFIVLTGLTEEDRLIIHDPNSKKNSEQSWDVERVMSQIKNLWSYSVR